MKMTPELEKAFNHQIDVELSSSISYLQMSAHFAKHNLNGMSSWMRAQAEEERAHAYRFLDFVLDRGNVARLGAIEAPRTEFESAEDVFATALEQEREVTLAIHELYRLATDHSDLASFPFLQSFIEEQNEEEAMVENTLERVKLAGGNAGAILILDSELGSRSAKV
ncbi:MAG: ferritin [Acidimicrobiia bacterium]